MTLLCWANSMRYTGQTSRLNVGPFIKVILIAFVVFYVLHLLVGKCAGSNVSRGPMVVFMGLALKFFKQESSNLFAGATN